MMIAPVIRRRELALRIVGAPKFPAPDHQRVVEQAALLQVIDQGRRRLIGFLALRPHSPGQTAVMIPALMIQLHELHAALGQAPREQAVGGEAAGLACIGTIRREGGFGFAAQVHDLGHARLHAVSHLVLGDASIDIRLAEAIGVVLVQVAQRIKHRAACFWRDAIRVVQIKHRALATAELHALMLAWQPATAPEARVKRLITFAFRNEHHERGQVLVVASETVVNPRADAGPAGKLRAGLQERDRGIVVDGLGVERPHDAKVVHHSGGVRKKFIDPGARFAVLGELEDRTRERKNRLVGRHAREALTQANRIGQRLAVALVQQRLVVEGLQLRGAAGHEQVDDPLRLWRELRGRQHAPVSAIIGEGACGIQKAGQRGAAEPHAEAIEKLAAAQASDGK